MLSILCINTYSTAYDSRDGMNILKKLYQNSGKLFYIKYVFL